MKRLLTYVFILGGVMLAALSGCQKEEVAPTGNEKAIASFYEANTSNTIVQKLAKNLSEQPDAQQKAQVLYQTYGKPLWDKAKIVPNAHSLQVLVPMEEVGYKHLTAIWGFDVKEDVISYNFLENEQSSPLYPKLGWLFPAMEQEIYKTSPNGKRYVRQGHLKINAVMQMTCYEVWVDYGKGSEYSYTNCYSSGVWIYDTPSGNGGTIPQTPSDYVPPHGNGNSNPTLPDRDPDPEVKKDSTFIDTKADCVFEKLVGTTATTLFDPNTVTGNLLKDFFSDKYNVKFAIVPASSLKNSSANAETYSPTSNNEIKVLLKDSYVNSCSMVELARTLIHESIHAQIFMVVKYPNEAYSSDSDFANLWARYKNYGNQAQHNVMAESNYISIIAKGLEEYHKNNRAVFETNLAERRLLEGFNYTEFYSNLAWAGLNKTEAFTKIMNNQDWYSKYNESLKQALNNDTFECK